MSLSDFTIHIEPIEPTLEDAKSAEQRRRLDAYAQKVREWRQQTLTLQEEGRRLLLAASQTLDPLVARAEMEKFYSVMVSAREGIETFPSLWVREHDWKQRLETLRAPLPTLKSVEFNWVWNDYETRWYEEGYSVNEGAITDLPSPLENYGWALNAGILSEGYNSSCSPPDRVDFSEEPYTFSGHPILAFFPNYQSPNPDHWYKVLHLITSSDEALVQQGFVLLESMMLEDERLLETVANLASCSLNCVFWEVHSLMEDKGLGDWTLISHLLQLIRFANQQLGRTNLLFPFETAQVLTEETEDGEELPLPLFASELERELYQAENVVRALPSILSRMSQGDLQRMVPKTWDQVWRLMQSNWEFEWLQTFLEWMFKDGKVLQWNPSLLELTELRLNSSLQEMEETVAFWSMPNVTTIDMSECGMLWWYDWTFLSSMPRLHTVNLSVCGLDEIPGPLYNCPIEYLDVSHNKLQEVPHDLRHMSSLKRLVLTNCMHDGRDNKEFEAFVVGLRQALPKCEIVTEAVG